jgi:hypothetical protein
MALNGAVLAIEKAGRISGGETSGLFHFQMQPQEF